MSDTTTTRMRNNTTDSTSASRSSSEIQVCSWCDCSYNSSLNTSTSILTQPPDLTTISTSPCTVTSNQQNKVFCSEKCFESSRRASFKRGRTCDWCSDGVSNSSRAGSSSQKDVESPGSVNQSNNNNNNNENNVISLDRLQFCTESCLNNYKQNIFQKETSVVLKAPAQVEDNNNNTNNNNNVQQRRLNNFTSTCAEINTAVRNSNYRISKSPLDRKTKFSKCSKKLSSTQFNSFNSSKLPFIPTTFPSLSDSVLPFSPQNYINNPKTSTYDSIKFPIVPPIYIPVPIPIPIPIFKSAPEILEILHKYGYQATKDPENEKVSKNKPVNNINCINIPHIIYQEPQTEALDLTKPLIDISSSSDITRHNNENEISVNSNNNNNSTITNHPNPISLTSILHLNDPYLKRRNRILDAPTPTAKETLSNTPIKNYCVSYKDLITNNHSHSHTTMSHSHHQQQHQQQQHHHHHHHQQHHHISSKTATKHHFKRRIDRHSTSNSVQQNKTTVNSTQSPKSHVHTASKALLRRYPLLSMRRNIKSAPSVVNANNIK